MVDPEAIMPLDGIQPEFEAQWPVFLEKLGIPITDQVRQFGEWAAVELRPVTRRVFHEPPLTVIHHDFQADNLLFGRASDSVPLVVIDWQMLVRGRGPVDLAHLLSGSMDPEDRRRHELQLVTRYALQLEQLGFGTTTLSDAWRTTAPPCCCRRSDSPSRSPSLPT
jgi:thiamine kinase-like enzyme